MAIKRKLVLGYLPGTGTVEPFDQIFEDSRNLLKESSDGVDAIVVWGGTDIHPSYYGQEAHHYNEVKGLSSPTERDVREWGAMKWAKAHNIPIIGVCRGAQMLCAFAGGRLIQHVDNHGMPHSMVCEDNRVRSINSYHHQMMYPFEVEHELLAWSVGRSKVYEDAGGSCFNDMRAQEFKEPEIVYFPGVDGLGIQFHPEWMDASGSAVQYCLDLVREKLLGQEVAVF